MNIYYWFELKAFIRNKKNLAGMILLLIAVLYYTVFAVPDYIPNEQVNEQEIRLEYEEMTHWLENRQGDGTSPGSSFSLAYFPPLVEIDEQRLNALETNDLSGYTSTTAEWYRYQDSWTYNYEEFLSYNRVYYGVDQDYPKQEGRYWYLETANRYDAYVDENIPLSKNVLEERTALQTGYRVLNTAAPFVLIALVVIFANDIVVKDRKHLTVVKSFPLSFSAKLWVKTGVVMTMVIGVTISLFLIGIVIVGMQNGLGSLSIPVSVFEGPTLIEDAYQTIRMGRFYLEAFVLFSMIAYGMTRLILLFSLLIRNEFFNLLAGIALIFTERLYYMRGIGYFSNLDRLPFTFFSIGQVLSGYQNHLYNSDNIDFLNGLLSIFILILCIELILFIVTRFKAVHTYI